MDAIFLAAAISAAAVLLGCTPREDDQIRVAHVPKEAPPATTAAEIPVSGNILAHDSSAQPKAATPGMQALPGMAEFSAATPTPKWSPPADWQVDSSMPTRKGSWKAPAPAGSTGAQPADVSVNIFQGQLGGLLMNVNRWRGKVGLAGDLTDAQLADNVKEIKIDGRTAQLVSFDGPQGQSLEGALVFLPDRAWVFLLSGDAATVKAQRAAFHEFLDSVKWQD